LQGHTELDEQSGPFAAGVCGKGVKEGLAEVVDGALELVDGRIPVAVDGRELGPQLSVQVLPVRSRTGTEISEPSKERKGLNMVAVGVEVPAFALEGKRLLSVPRPGSQAADQVALGRGPGDGKERITRLQTCITPRGVVALSASTLAAQEPGQAPEGLAAALQRRTLRLAGLLPAHYECLAVQVEAEAKGADQAQLVGVWKELRTTLLP
jgi:hypothetical protein